MIQSPASGFGSEIGGELTIGGDMAFGDPGALADPGVAGLHHGFKRSVGEYLLRQIGADAGDA